MEYSTSMGLPSVPTCDTVSLEHHLPPKPMIQTDNDVSIWQHSESYSHLLLYIRRLGDAVVDTELRSASADASGKVSIKLYFVYVHITFDSTSQFVQF
jgi:hypothetical protein